LPSSWEGPVVDDRYTVLDEWTLPRKGRKFMSELDKASVGTLDPAQARELAVLVDLEARWENLRYGPSRDSEGRMTPASLLAVQNAYAAFRVKLDAYNKRYRPAHVPELLLNTPLRLGAWCRAMRDLYLQVQHDAQFVSPVALLEKAHRCANRVSGLMKTSPINRSAPPTTVVDAIAELGALVQWCDDIAGAAASA
jgi:hypothetical protein